MTHKTFLTLIGIFVLASIYSCKNEKNSEYIKVKNTLLKGWKTANTQNALSYVLFPENFEVSLSFQYQGRNFQGYHKNFFLNDGYNWEDAILKPIANWTEGGYTKAELQWQDIHVIIETAVKDNDLVALITPVSTLKNPSHLILKTGLLWNKDKHYTKKFKNSLITYITPFKRITLHSSGKEIKLYNVPESSPYIAIELSDTSGFSIGKKRTHKEISTIINFQRNAYESKAASYGENLTETWKAIITCLNYNSIYDPINNRLVSTVSRQWNVKRGGYSFFGWDNFFLAYMSVIHSKELAYSNAIEHLNDATPEGFIPNCSQANGRQTLDRSQPPVGSIMIKEIYKNYPEEWFLEATFDKLLRWNRWWMEKRFHKGMLSWGSHKADNPFNDPRMYDLKSAMLETGIDDSPMYEDVIFNYDSAVMEMHDVGLNALYIADCDALAEIAEILHKTKEADELKARANYFREQLKTLWVEKNNLYLNKKTNDNTFSTRLSPTLFYPWFANISTPEQTQKMINNHYFNTNEFYGDWVLPSISRDDTTFYRQKYWKGAIWAPLNFLVYLSMRNSPGTDTARIDLAKKSNDLFVKEWLRKNYIGENYCAITGTADDERIQSDHYYTWGALLGIIAFIEDGQLQKTEIPLKK
jgi:putative isomerase